jgi:succinate dehydrogenase / fumarate reductase cytochrome b subunit
VGKKLIMALTGLFLVIFLIEHVIGNLLLLRPDGGEAFTEYSENLVHNPFIRTIEIFLFAAFIFHIIDGLYLFFRNRGKRPQRYAVSNRSANSAWTSRNMAVTGTIILFFLIVHLKSFFVPYRITNTEALVSDPRYLYHTTVEAFRNIWYSLFYIVVMILIGLHLHHGFRSAFQTIGMRSPKYYPFVRGLGVFLALALTIGFAIIPLYFILTR